MQAWERSDTHSIHTNTFIIYLVCDYNSGKCQSLFQSITHSSVINLIFSSDLSNIALPTSALHPLHTSIMLYFFAFLNSLVVFSWTHGYIAV